MNATRRRIRVLCVDDHAFVVDGLEARFSMEKDLECVQRLPDATRVAEVVAECRPDVVLMDIEMPGPDPFEVTADVARRFPETRVAFLSAFVRDHYVSAAFKAGAWGYFSKSDEPEAIIEGIRLVSRGEFAMSPAVEERCRPRAPVVQGERLSPDKVSSRLDALSDREIEVLRLMGRGMSRSQIAETLHRSAKTVDGHRERIMEKLDIHTSAELVRFANQEGLA